MVDAREQALLRTLQARGGRVTPQRRAIIRALLAADHPSIEQVHAQVRRVHPEVSLVTVYRTMTALHALGEVLAVDAGFRQAHYDGLQPGPHAHLICRTCGRAADAAATDIPSQVALTRAASGWVLSGQVNIYGLCPDCRAFSEDKPMDPTS